MLTIPIQPAHPSGSQTSASPPSVLVIGRSEQVLQETVELLHNNGRAAGATNDFDNVLTHFDIASLDIVVFGGMVPPQTKEAVRTSLATANPTITFVQGLAGIPALIAEQVQAALAPSRQHPDSITYNPDSRTVTISLQSTEHVRVIGFWHTSFTPPDPKSTREIIFDATIEAGTHTIPLPASIPTTASFIAVHIDTDVHPFVVGPMPSGTTMAPQPA